MLKKLISLSLVAALLSVTAFASADVAVFTAAYAEEESETTVFSYAASEIDFVTETTSVGSAKHEPIETLPTWDGTTAVTPDTDADGAYLISSAAELAGFATLVNTKGETSGTYDNCAINAKLDRDINMSGQNWASFAIGGMETTDYIKTTNGYIGDFDGQGHNIYNFKYSATSSTTSKHGLFRAVGSGGSIKNLNMIDVDYEVGSNVNYGTIATGIVCGNITGAYETSPAKGAWQRTNPTTISNVYISGNASLIGAKKIGIYGSVAGYVSQASVENCVSSVNVNFEGQASTIPQTFSTGSKVSGCDYGIGGIVGAVGDGWNGVSLISNCGNLGAVYAPANRRVGGVVGAYENTSSNAEEVGARNLWNKGTVTGYGQVAGVIGFIYAPAPSGKEAQYKNWYNTGNVTAVQATDAYAAGVYTSPRAVTTGGYFYSTGDVKIAVTDAETGNVTESFDSTCGLIGAGAQNTTTNQLYRSDLKTKYTADTTVGTGKTIAEIQAMTAADMDAVLGAGYVADCGINGGLPILSAQLEKLVLDEEKYDIANGKSLAVDVDEAGYVALEVTAIVEGSAFTVTPKDGVAYDVTVSETGLVMIPTNGATEITVSAAEGNRFLVKEASDLSLAELEATAIKATVASNESATIVLALYNTADNTLETVVYASNIVVEDGKISAVIDLTSEDIADCELRAYVWANDTLMPIRTEITIS